MCLRKASVSRASRTSAIAKAAQRGRLVGALRPFFPRLITDRGADYFRRGAVEVLEWTEQGIRAHVQGRTLYTTGLACRPREARSVEGPLAVSLWCDCPFLDAYDTPCKHLWALIQEADALGALGALFATGSRQVRSVQLGRHPTPIRDEEPAASTVTTRARSPRDEIAGRTREASPASLRTGKPEPNGRAHEVSAGDAPALEKAALQAAAVEAAALDAGRPLELLCSIDPEEVRSSGRLLLAVWVRRGRQVEPFHRGTAVRTELDAVDRWIAATLGRPVFEER